MNSIFLDKSNVLHNFKYKSNVVIIFNIMLVIGNYLITDYNLCSMDELFQQASQLASVPVKKKENIIFKHHEKLTWPYLNVNNTNYTDIRFTEDLWNDKAFVANVKL